MKRFIIFAFLFCSLYVNSQCTDCLYKSNEIWISVVDNTVIDKSGDTYFVNKTELNSIFQEYLAYKISPVFPYSRLSDLKTIYKVEFNGNIDDFMSELNQNQFVKHAYKRLIEENIAIYQPSDYFWYVPSANDPNGWLWHLKRIDAEHAWDYSHGDSDIKIGTIDTWFDINHPDLTNKFLYPYDPFDNQYFSSNYSNNNHGTTQASFIASQTDGGGDLAAIGFNCMMIGYQAWDGDYIQRAHHASLVMNADVITSSAGGWTCTSSVNEIEKLALKEILDNGTVVVMPAGNGWNGTNCHYNGQLHAFKPLSPEYDERVIMVTSVDKDDKHQVFNSSGNDVTHSHFPEVDVCAPGYAMMGATCTVDGSGMPNNWPYSGNCSGTSFAAPIVAGLCGLLKSINKDFTPSEIQYIIKSTTDPVVDADLFPGIIGTGRVNAYRAAKMASECNPIIITGNETWNEDRTIICGLTISQGATLTITSTVQLSKRSKIVIERGGKLILNNGNLTNLDNFMWLGIEVQGNSDEIQAAAYQGVLEINGGTIENAICAVKTYKPDPSMETYPFDPQYSGLEGWTGGMVLATNATFRNNRMGVVFPSYLLGSASFFDACTFETTGDLPDASIPDYFVRMNHIAGVQFFGCVFRNTNPDPDLLPENRGSGIYAYDATLVVSPKCQDANCTTFTRGSFSKLYYGIRDLSSGENRTTYLDRQDFVDNFRGVYFGGRNYVEFTRNYIRPFAEQTSQDPQTYGVYFDQCTGYHIEENTFDSENTAKVGIGLIVHKSGQEANEVYRNTFTNLRYASIAQSYNRGRNNEGLCYKCNNFDNNLYDVKISRNHPALLATTDGIAAYQGYYAVGNNQAPAGNLFSNIPNNGSFAFYNSANGINYYKHQNPPYPSRTHPVYCQGTGSVYVIPVPYTEYNSSACPSKLDLGDGSADDRDMMAAASGEATALSAGLANLKDGGSTEALTQTVEAGTAAQAVELRDELLAVSPYLTDTVLDASIQQEEALPNALLRDVMVANPQAAKSDELLTKLDNRQTPMPNEMWNEIMGGAAVSGDKENMEAAIGFWKNEEYYRWSRINRRMLINQAVADSMVEEWSNSPLIEARSNLALYYLSTGDPTQGLLVLDTTLAQLSEASPEWNELVALQGYIQTIATDYPLPDTSMTASFEALTEQSDGLAEALSRNALIQTGALSYNEPILVDEGLKSANVRKFGIRPVEENNQELLKVYPNPAKGYFVAKVELSGSRGLLELVSSTGVTVLERIVEQSSSLTIPVSHLADGVYTMHLTVNGVQKASIKITLQ